MPRWSRRPAPRCRRRPTRAVQLVEASPAAGHAAGAPYDLILIEGAVPAVPPAVQAQFAEGGRLVTILATPGGQGRAVLVRRAGELHPRPRFMRPARRPRLRPAPAFAFLMPCAARAPGPPGAGRRAADVTIFSGTGVKIVDAGGETPFRGLKSQIHVVLCLTISFS